MTIGIIVVLLLAVGTSSLLYSALTLPDSAVTEVRFIVVTDYSGTASGASGNNSNTTTPATVEYVADVSVQYRSGGSISIGPLQFTNSKVGLTITSAKAATPGFKVVATSPLLPIQVAQGIDTLITFVIQTPRVPYTGPLVIAVMSVV
jgi:hypothetical protein